MEDQLKSYYITNSKNTKVGKQYLWWRVWEWSRLTLTIWGWSKKEIGDERKRMRMACHIVVKGSTQEKEHEWLSVPHTKECTEDRRTQNEGDCVKI